MAVHDAAATARPAFTRSRHGPQQSPAPPAPGPLRYGLQPLDLLSHDQFAGVRQEHITSAWVSWCNETRLMHRLGRRPPAEVAAEYYAHLQVGQHTDHT
jgi:hypothetical protein